MTKAPRFLAMLAVACVLWPGAATAAAEPFAEWLKGFRADAAKAGRAADATAALW